MRCIKEFNPLLLFKFLILLSVSSKGEGDKCPYNSMYRIIKRELLDKNR